MSGCEDGGYDAWPCVNVEWTGVNGRCVGVVVM